MKRSLTPKQERFCQAYVETGDASEAYRRAYNAENMKRATIHRRAFDQLQNGKLTARIEEIQNEHRERHNVTIDSLTEELEQARLIAVEEKTASAAVTATMGKAKLHGLDINKHDVAGDLVIRWKD